MDIVDPRRLKPIEIQWFGLIGRLLIDGESWGAVEWSDKRQAFCIEDAEGRCLSHHSHIHGADKDKAGAVALAEAMIRDGRMPTPEEARKARTERLKRDRERRAKQPSGVRRALNMTDCGELTSKPIGRSGRPKETNRSTRCWQMLSTSPIPNCGKAIRLRDCATD